MYFAGGSKGGHEGLVAAQRYGRDYDGVISYYPAKDSVGLILAWGVLTEAAYGPGAVSLSVKKQRYIQEATMDACDTLDGLKDGIIANTAACAATISPVSLACKPDDDPGGECLTVAETATLSAGLRRTPYPYPLANGVSALGPFPVMSGGTFEGSWISQGGRAVTAYDFLTNGIVRNFWTEDAQARFGSLDFAALRETIRAHSQASDATSADLDAFAGHGGKLILVQGSLDMLVPPSATTDYFLRVAGRYGDRSDNIVRYFVQPGYGHGTGEFNLSWDSLGALDSWVDTGAFPKYPVATDGNPATRNRQMPLCEYPLFPRYISGDASKATSFRCEAH